MSKKITSFFKEIKPNSRKCEEEAECEEDNSEHFAQQFYGDCVTQQNSTCDIDYLNIKAKLKSEIMQMQAKNRNMKEAINICSEIIADKDIEIQNLMEQLTSAANVNVVDKLVPVGDTSDDVGVQCVDPIEKATNEHFITFQNNFNPDQLSYLRSISNQSDKDSHFIKTAVEALYEGRLDVLKNRSVTGRSAGGQSKQKMTPQKHSILNTIFTERIINATPNSAERVLRQKKLNSLIKNAIHNISRANNADECIKKPVKTCYQMNKIKNLFFYFPFSSDVVYFLFLFFTA